MFDRSARDTQLFTFYFPSFTYIYIISSQYQLSFQNSILEKERVGNAVLFLDKCQQVIMDHIQACILFTPQLRELFINRWYFEIYQLADRAEGPSLPTRGIWISACMNSILGTSTDDSVVVDHRS